MAAASTKTTIRPEASPKMMMMASTIKIKDNRSAYPGGKGGSGVHQTIINLIPPHDTYIETHLGAGSIMRYKRPAPINIGIDLDPEVTTAWERFLTATTKKPEEHRSNLTGSGTIGINDEGSGTPSIKIKSCGGESFMIKRADAGSFLENYQFKGGEFVYVDPPYLLATRKGGKLYNFEYTDQDHIDLLNVLKTLPCMVMVSGYWSSLYAGMLPGWNTHSFEAQTRQGMATEWLWFNYPPPDRLHDYSYLGETFRDRERIKKKRDRLVARILRTPALERNAMLQALVDCVPELASPEKTMGAG